MPQEFILTAPRTIEYREYMEPPLAPGELRIRSVVSGIKTGTEMNIYRGTTPFLNNRFDEEYRVFLPAEENAVYPCTLDSWLVGEVIEIGRGVTGFTVGELVHGQIPHRPTNVFPAADVFKVPKGINIDMEVFVDPGIVALLAAHDGEIKVGDRVAIFGMGAIGLLTVQIAKLNGAEQVIAVDMLENRLELARQFGADETVNPANSDPGLAIKNLTHRQGVDVAIEVTGSYSGLQQAIRSVQREGLVVAAGYYTQGPPLMLGAEWHHNRVTMRSSMLMWGCLHRRHPLWDLRRIEQTVIRLLESGRLRTDPMITHRFSYDDAAAAYHLLDTQADQTLKVLLTY